MTKFACAACRRVYEGDSAEALGWAKRHDGTFACKECHPGGQGSIEERRAEQASIEADMALVHDVPATPAAKLARLAALDRLRAKNVIR